MSERKKKSEVESPKSENENNSTFDIPDSEINKTEIENSKSEINMEVHHHPDLHHEKKPWKEYLLEGLMIFLAVTMGFFAESLRENISAKEKEHEYVASFQSNLEKDKAE